MKQATEKAEWRVSCAHSGSIVVGRRGIAASYWILYPRTERDEAGRMATARALRDWLNGGERREELNVLFRDKPFSVLLESGHHIQAGTIEDGPDAELECWRLIEALVTDRRPEAS